MAVQAAAHHAGARPRDRITQFMTGMFIVPDPSEARGNTVTAREILDKASKEIDTGLQNDPELQANMMYTMADTYLDLGLYSRAQPLLERALEIQRRVLGPQNPDTLASMQDPGELFGVRRSSPPKRRNWIARRSISSAGPWALRIRHTPVTMDNLARSLLYQNHYAEAEKLQREALDIRRRLPGPGESGHHDFDEHTWRTP